MKRFLSKAVFCAIISLCLTNCTKSTRVTRVIDGDTFVIKPYEVVRIIGIDAPELDQDSIKFIQDTKKHQSTSENEKNAAVEAKLALSALLLKKKVKLIPSENFKFERLDHNRFARNLYFVEFEGKDVAETLLSNGHVRVWDEEQFPKVHYTHENDSLYKSLQESAKSNKVGLWQVEKTEESPSN